jgi:hypothetical protein
LVYITGPGSSSPTKTTSTPSYTYAYIPHGYAGSSGIVYVPKTYLASNYTLTIPGAGANASTTMVSGGLSISAPAAVVRPNTSNILQISVSSSSTALFTVAMGVSHNSTIDLVGSEFVRLFINPDHAAIHPIVSYTGATLTVNMYVTRNSSGNSIFNTNRFELDNRLYSYLGNGVAATVTASSTVGVGSGGIGRHVFASAVSYAPAIVGSLGGPGQIMIIEFQN